MPAIPEPIRDAVAGRFAAWPSMRLPAEAELGVPVRLPSEVGWGAAWRLDETGGALVLTLFSAHRMSDPELTRIRADGSTETVASGSGLYAAKADPARSVTLEQAQEAARREMQERVAAFWALVEHLGLGDATPPAAAINAVLHLDA